jgi:hypothetical protein
MMMNKFKFLIFFACSGCVLFLLLSNASGAGNAQGADRTGSPLGIGTCGSCHSGGNYLPVLNVAIVEGDQQITRYVPGKQYQIKVTLDGKNNPREYGFQLTALVGANNQSAGIFGQAPSGFRQITLDNRRYIEHSSPSVATSFVIAWTAPAAGLGPVRFYASGLTTNNNNGTGGDSPVHLTSPVILSESISSFISTIPELKGEVKIFPNPISSLLQIHANSLPVGKLNFQVLDIFGRIYWEMETHTVEANLTLNVLASNWFPGIYYLKISDNKAIKTIAFVKN